jgi:hypothetical protein
VFTQLTNFIQNLRNSIDYPLRQVFHLQRPGLRFKNENKERMFSELTNLQRVNAEAISTRLRRQYNLQKLYLDSTLVNYQENLFYLEMLERALSKANPTLPQVIHTADIGCSSWFYVQSLYALLQWWQNLDGRKVFLTGYEIDAYRLYADFHSRYDHAIANIRDLTGVHYIPEGFKRRPEHFHLITMLFPFIFPQDHLTWGLPHAYFRPEKLLADAYNSLVKPGVLVIVNQGEREHQAQLDLLQSAGISYTAAFRHDSVLFEYDLSRFVIVVRRDE